MGEDLCGFVGVKIPGPPPGLREIRDDIRREHPHRAELAAIDQFARAGDLDQSAKDPAKAFAVEPL